MNPLRSRIFEFAYFHEYDRKLEDLVLIAQDEVWDHSEYTARKFPILRNYLEKTFEKLEEEKKIVFSKSGDHACFNSGLITSFSFATSTAKETRVGGTSISLKVPDMESFPPMDGSPKPICASNAPSSAANG